MISILSNHALNMNESNVNVLKSSNGMKVGRLNKREEKRPTILTKPSSAKNLDDSIGKNEYEVEKGAAAPTQLQLQQQQQKLLIKSSSANSVKKPEEQLSRSIGTNGYSVPKQLYQPQQQTSNQNAEKLARANSIANNTSLTPTASSAQQQQQQVPANQPLPPINVRLNTGPYLNSSIKLLDDNFTWQEQFQEYLLEQSDYLVVGVIGKQGVGKSTLLSLLAGNKFTDSNENMMFRPAGKDIRENAQNKTNAIQAYVTTERTILLDVQPILSSSILERSINTERKHTNNDFKFYENFIEIQSIELVCFILTVCDVVLVAEDWFTDPNLFRLIQTAEMLMPNMHVPGSQDEFIEHYPHMVYVLNKSDYVSKSEVQKMKKAIDRLMCDSKITYKGSLSEFRNHLSHKRRLNNENVNFVVIPKADGYDHDWQNNVLPEFGGLSSLDKSIKYLQREILGVKRTSFINNPMFTEKKWFAYATKVWETIRKSPMISEYNRLMT